MLQCHLVFVREHTPPLDILLYIAIKFIDVSGKFIDVSGVFWLSFDLKWQSVLWKE